MVAAREARIMPSATAAPNERSFDNRQPALFSIATMSALPLPQLIALRMIDR